MNSIVKIYTDGGCEPNPGLGGWGAVIIENGHERHLFGYESPSTNNRMALMAAIAALEAVQTSSVIKLTTDSQYVKNGISTWLPGWIVKNWRTAAGEPVKNRDLWERLHLARQRHVVEWKWTRGHTGDHYNELADKLATKARTTQTSSDTSIASTTAPKAVKPFNLKRPPHLIANEVIREIEAALAANGDYVSFGRTTHEIIERLVAQYQEMLP